MTNAVQTVESLLSEHSGTGRDSPIPILQEVQDSQGTCRATPSSKWAAISGCPTARFTA
jgi:hypothetical protein